MLLLLRVLLVLVLMLLLLLLLGCGSYTIWNPSHHDAQHLHDVPVGAAFHRQPKSLQLVSYFVCHFTPSHPLELLSVRCQLTVLLPCQA